MNPSDEDNNGVGGSVVLTDASVAPFVDEELSHRLRFDFPALPSAPAIPAAIAAPDQGPKKQKTYEEEKREIGFRATTSEEEEDEAGYKRRRERRTKKRKEKRRTAGASPVTAAAAAKPGTANPGGATGTAATAFSIEVDFYNNPTLLSRLVLNQKYGSALARLKRHPEEAKVWVCAKRRIGKGKEQLKDPRKQQQPHLPQRSRTRRGGKRHRRGDPQQQQQQQQQEEGAGVSSNSNSGDDDDPPAAYSIRQLPLHIACINLCRALDVRMRALLNDLVAKLVVSYPGSCQQPDHRGILPVQEAVWCGASPETISLLLMAHPESVDCRDPRGRSLTELNRHGPGSGTGNGGHGGAFKKQVQEILNLDAKFWEETRLEATLRLKQETVHWPSSSPHEGDDYDVASKSVLASSQVADESLPTNREEYNADNPRPVSPSPIQSDEILPIAWEQVEERALAAEQILCEVNENNFGLSRRIKSLTRSKLRLVDRLDRIRNSDLARDARLLQDDNLKLRGQISRMERLLREAITAARADAAGGGSYGSDPPGKIRDGTLEGEEEEEETSVTYGPHQALHAVYSSSSSSSSSAVAMRIVAEENQKLRHRYHELNTSYHEQRDRLRRLERAIDAVLTQEIQQQQQQHRTRRRRRRREEEEDHEDTVSGLTSPEEDVGSRGTSSSLTTIDLLEGISECEGDEPVSGRQKEKVEIAWSPPSPLSADLSDSLSVVFRRAAAAEDHHDDQPVSTYDTPTRVARQRPMITSPLFHPLGEEEEAGSLSSHRSRDLLIPAMLPVGPPPAAAAAAHAESVSPAGVIRGDFDFEGEEFSI